MSSGWRWWPRLHNRPWDAGCTRLVAYTAPSPYSHRADHTNRRHASAPHDACERWLHGARTLLHCPRKPLLQSTATSPSPLPPVTSTSPRISKPKGHDLGHPGVYDQYGKDAFYGKHPDAEAPRRFAGASDGRERRLDVDQRGTGNGSSLDALSSEMHRHGGAGAAPRSFPGCTGRSGCGCSACASSASAFQTSLPSSSSSSSSSNAARKANRNTNVGSRPSWDDGSAAEPATRDASYYAAMRGELTHGHAR